MKNKSALKGIANQDQAETEVAAFMAEPLDHEGEEIINMHREMLASKNRPTRIYALLAMIGMGNMLAKRKRKDKP